MNQNMFGRLESVDLRPHWESESGNFTPWLAQTENILLLGDSLGIDLEVISQEQPVGFFKADILAKDTINDRYVIIENQLEKTDHIHLGQLITYAAGLDAVIIVWISPNFRDEHRAAIDWLNRITNENITFFGIQIELWRIGDSLPAPRFNIVAKPNDWEKNIQNSIDSTHLTETELMLLEYWNQFKGSTEEKGSTLKIQKPYHQNWIYVSLGTRHFKIACRVNSQKKWIAVTLWISGENRKSIFYELKQKYEILSYQTISPDLHWDERPTKKDCMVELLRKDVDPNNRQDWPSQHEWLRGMSEKFHDFFEGKIQSIKSED
ncbi:MAG: DUF4268 domain-containing protein [Methanoregula sp.]|nr:DUF4268 domain-containing protein [Methanoregula sp.]